MPYLEPIPEEYHICWEQGYQEQVLEIPVVQVLIRDQIQPMSISGGGVWKIFSEVEQGIHD